MSIDLLRDLGYTGEEAASARRAALLEELAAAEEEIVAAVESLALHDEEIMDGLTEIGRCYECGSQTHIGPAHE